MGRRSRHGVEVHEGVSFLAKREWCPCSEAAPESHSLGHGAAHADIREAAIVAVVDAAQTKELCCGNSGEPVGSLVQLPKCFGLLGKGCGE